MLHSQLSKRPVIHFTSAIMMFFVWTWNFYGSTREFVVYFSDALAVFLPVDSHHCLWMNRKHQTITSSHCLRVTLCSFLADKSSLQNKICDLPPHSIFQVNVQNWSVECKCGAPVIWGYNFLLCAGKFVFPLCSIVLKSWVQVLAWTRQRTQSAPAAEQNTGLFQNH